MLHTPVAYRTAFEARKLGQVRQITRYGVLRGRLGFRRRLRQERGRRGLDDVRTDAYDAISSLICPDPSVHVVLGVGAPRGLDPGHVVDQGFQTASSFGRRNSVTIASTRAWVAALLPVSWTRSAVVLRCR